MDLMRRFVNTMRREELAEVLDMIAERFSDFTQPFASGTHLPMPTVMSDATRAALKLAAFNLRASGEDRLYPDLDESEKNMIRDPKSYGYEGTGKVPAIKSMRERLGLGLKEAMDAVNHWMSNNGY